MRRDAGAVGEQFAGVLKHDHAVAEQAPTLLRVARNDPGRVAIDRVGGWTQGLVLAHRRFPSRSVNGHYDQPGTVLPAANTYEAMTAS